MKNAEWTSFIIHTFQLGLTLSLSRLTPALTKGEGGIQEGADGS